MRFQTLARWWRVDIKNMGHTIPSIYEGIRDHIPRESAKRISTDKFLKVSRTNYNCRTMQIARYPFLVGMPHSYKMASGVMKRYENNFDNGRMGKKILFHLKIESHRWRTSKIYGVLIKLSLIQTTKSMKSSFVQAKYNGQNTLEHS
jgi:hypothetical protein